MSLSHLDNTQSYQAEFGVQQIGLLFNLFQILDFYTFVLLFFMETV